MIRTGKCTSAKLLVGQNRRFGPRFVHLNTHPHPAKELVRGRFFCTAAAAADAVGMPAFGDEAVAP